MKQLGLKYLDAGYGTKLFNWLISNNSIEEIKECINNNYYNVNFKIYDIRSRYKYDILCQGTVPPVIVAFLESNSF